MEFNQALGYMTLLCVTVVTVLLLCFLFNDKINIKGFYGYFMCFGAIGLFVAAMTLVGLVSSQNNANRKEDCRAKVAPLITENNDYAARDLESILRAVCV